MVRIKMSIRDARVLTVERIYDVRANEPRDYLIKELGREMADKLVREPGIMRVHDTEQHPLGTGAPSPTSRWLIGNLVVLPEAGSGGGVLHAVKQARRDGIEAAITEIREMATAYASRNDTGRAQAAALYAVIERLEQVMGR